MKMKKALAVVLTVVMLVLPLTVSSFAVSSEVVTAPVKTAYNDAEYFNPIGLVISVDGNEITYSPANTKFRFSPALNELLTVETTAVSVFYNNELVGTVPVSVSHILGDLTAINNGHGHYCLGCGVLHDFEKHNVEEWIPNDDAGIFIAQTQTGYCTVCGAEVTETIPGSEKFLGLFDIENGSLTETELTIVTYFYQIVVSLIQTLVGIS